MFRLSMRKASAKSAMNLPAASKKPLVAIVKSGKMEFMTQSDPTPTFSSRVAYKVQRSAVEWLEKAFGSRP